MDQEKYKEVARLQAQATRAASELLNPMWDDMLTEYERVTEGLCPGCGSEPDEGGWCDSCQREAEPSPLMALDPLSIEDDGRIILGFGGPNIWVDAADNLCYAWWDSPVRAPSPSSRHDAMVEAWREEILELA